MGPATRRDPRCFALAVILSTKQWAANLGCPLEPSADALPYTEVMVSVAKPSMYLLVIAKGVTVRNARITTNVSENLGSW